MPQETKSMPGDADDEALGVVHENLEGWVPPLDDDDEIRDALEKAFDYRGDVTLTLRDGRRVEGYIFDRSADSQGLADCFVRLFPRDGGDQVSVAYCDIARLEFTGRDTAAGKSFETWVRKYRERKAAGEKGIGLEPEKLD